MREVTINILLSSFSNQIDKLSHVLSQSEHISKVYELLLLFRYSLYHIIIDPNNSIESIFVLLWHISFVLFDTVNNVFSSMWTTSIMFRLNTITWFIIAHECSLLTIFASADKYRVLIVHAVEWIRWNEVVLSLFHCIFCNYYEWMID